MEDKLTKAEKLARAMDRVVCGGRSFTRQLAAQIRDELRRLDRPAPAVPDDVADWRDDPTADERWNAGCDFAMTQLCVVLEVDPKSVSWDAATEELEGDVRSVIGNIITAAFGDDWPTPATIEAQAAELARLREENALMAASLDEEERKHGLSTNGNMWRFWSQQLREYHERRAKERAALTHPTGEPT